jgi:hypothetical protein
VEEQSTKEAAMKVFLADDPVTRAAWNEAFGEALGLRRKLRATPRFRDATGWAPAYRDATVGLQQVGEQHRAT